MKRLLLVPILVGLASAAASDAGWCYRYATSRHNIRVACPEVGSGQCTYEVWNKPKSVGQGKADLAIQGGKHILVANGNSLYRFTTGNAVIELFDALRDNRHDSLDIYINGRRKSHYRLIAK